MPVGPARRAVEGAGASRSRRCDLRVGSVAKRQRHREDDHGDIECVDRYALGLVEHAEVPAALAIDGDVGPVPVSRLKRDSPKVLPMPRFSADTSVCS